MLKKIIFINISLLAQSIWALESDFKQSIYFQANQSQFNHYQATFSASGDIKISQGTILIQASSANGSLRDGMPYQITLKGNPVKFQQQLDNGMVYGTANTILYNSTSSEISLKGNAQIKQQGAHLSGETLRYNLTLGDVEAKGSATKRVQIIIPPQKDLKIKKLESSETPSLRPPD